MQQATGRIYTGDEVAAMKPADQAKCHPLPDDVNVDTIRKLQNAPGEQARRAALKSLNRAKNKAARKARRRNRSS